MNFAEQLSYWYLRLNGFLPLTNFVLHHQPGEHRTSDADMIAIRFPHVFEAIGGQPDDWDGRFRQWGMNLTAETIGLVVEVKSGEWSENAIATHLRDKHWRVSDSIRRLGVFPQAAVGEITTALESRPIERRDGFTIAKLLIGKHPPLDRTWLHLTLEDAVGFIGDRMAKYSSRKYGDRIFFDGDLIQFLAWRGERKL